MALSQPQKSHYYEFKVKAKELYLGFSVSKGYTVAVVPRFWFPNPEKIPAMKIDGAKIIVLPDKGSRIIESSEKIEADCFETEKGKSWIQINPHSLNDKSIKAEILKYKNENESQQDMEKLEALFYTVWENKSENKSKHLLELGAGSNQFQYFLFIGIIEEINEQMRELRRSYNELRVRTSTLRGRIDFAATIPLIASGSPEMICITEEFSLTTPHYSALMTAIDVIISTPLKTKKTMFDGFLNKLRTEASITRARFREIPSMPFGMAIRTLRSTPVPPQLRKWNNIFDFALHLLEGDGVYSNTETVSTKPYWWQSSYFWENIVEQISEKAELGEVSTQAQAKMNNPWIKMKETEKNVSANELTSKDEENSDSDEHYIIAKAANKKPDVVISYDDKDMDLIIDAKYYSSASKVMSSSNYQFLGYALAQLHEPKSAGNGNKVKPIRKRRVHFAIPEKHKGGEIVTLDKEQRYKLQYPFTILKEKGDIDPQLYGLKIQFPQPKVFLPNTNDESEGDYFSRAGKSLHEMMKQLDKREK